MKLIDQLHLTPEQHSDFQKYVPESDTVKLVFEEMVGSEINNWEEAIASMMLATVDGDKDALFDLLELVYLNAHNEGLIEATSDELK